MPSASILHTLRRRPILRRVLSLAGYLGGAAVMVSGGRLFYAGPAVGDQVFASGLLLCGGLALIVWTSDLRDAIHAIRKPDPIES